MALYIGLMSGTSLDGVDGVLADIDDAYCGGPIPILSSVAIPFDLALKNRLMELQAPTFNEIEKQAQAANALVHIYAENISKLLKKANLKSADIKAIGVHGQTIRHRPELAYTCQINNPALLAELTNIDVIADFRHRDIAAGGQGAPLVPAFHQAVFGERDKQQVILNIGGIANISLLLNDSVMGFDTGPGNMLLDAWIKKQCNRPFDVNGEYAKSGQINESLLQLLLQEPYFKKHPPKSTGRDLFHLKWLEDNITKTKLTIAPEDVQCTITELTAITIANSISQYGRDAKDVICCGGGSKNTFLMQRISHHLQQKDKRFFVRTSLDKGIDPMHVEALAFAWLAHRFIIRASGNLPAVTGAKGKRILGALYPAHY